ncbi:MAG: NAD-dependent deacylase [Acidobacteriota bacterium]|nr:NAD-dependent deacylase [Blastocatellia bacterium]MDW8412063.1 NAD-dependent deacylase [Acidobacteriota bacterium]
MLDVEKAATWLSNAKSIAVLTGAGVSAESGIPTFRDAMDGLWAQFEPERLASRQGFMADPKLVWQWYEERRATIKRCRPNSGHIALAELEAKKPVTVITQNVDGLHSQAGSKRVLELHGNIMRNSCFIEGKLLRDDELDTASVPPKCPCGSYARPAVVWFGEFLPEDVLEAAISASRHADVFLIAGTSGVVQPAASLPLLAAERGARIIEINNQESALTPIAHISLRSNFAVMMPKLVSLVS